MKNKVLRLRNFSRINQYRRKGAISIEEGLERIKKGGIQVVLGVSTSFYGSRLQTYVQKGITCVTCGVEGKYFALEKCWKDQPKEKYHINLWGMTKKGKHFLLTSDHIQPKSRGGVDDVSNRQPMCSACNNRKGNLLPGEKVYISPQNLAHNCFQSMRKIMRESLEREGYERIV